VLKKEVLTREHGSDKDARPPAVPPASRKPKNVMPIENAFRELQIGTAQHLDGDSDVPKKNGRVTRVENSALKAGVDNSALKAGVDNSALKAGAKRA
jgi:hypothetical protein